MLWAINEYKEKIDHMIPRYIHCKAKEFKTYSIIAWAIEEIQNRVKFKSVRSALCSIEEFIDICESYDGKSKESQQAFQVAAEVGQFIHDMIYEQFVI